MLRYLPEQTWTRMIDVEQMSWETINDLSDGAKKSRRGLIPAKDVFILWCAIALIFIGISVVWSWSSVWNQTLKQARGHREGRVSMERRLWALMVSGWRFLVEEPHSMQHSSRKVASPLASMMIQRSTLVPRRALTCYERARETTQRQNNQACRSCCPPLNNPAEHNFVLLIVLYDIWYTILLQAYHSGLGYTASPSPSL